MTEEEAKLLSRYRYICRTCEFRCFCFSTLSTHQLTHVIENTNIHLSEDSFVGNTLIIGGGDFSPFLDDTRGDCSTRPYVCPICRKNFRLPTTLANHRRIHTGEKPYQCNVCKRQFRQVATLNKHCRNPNIHNQVISKQFPCLRCHKSFSRKNYLHKHVSRIHEGKNRNLKCEQPVVSDFIQFGQIGHRNLV